MSSAGPNAASAHSLPLDVLEAVLELLPDVEDRARCVLVCRHFYGAATTSRRLWRDVSVYGAGIASLERAAVRHGGLGIQRLRWYVGARPASWSRFALRGQGELTMLWRSFTATLQAASGSLRSLSLQHMPDMLVKIPLPQLGHLTSLEVDWRGTEPELRLLSNSLTKLSALQSLSLGSSLLGTVPSRPVLAGLPPGLREVSLTALNLAELPAGITAAAASLLHLYLERCYFAPQQAAWATLSRLTALTSLGWVECEWPRGFALPAQVSALRQLEELYVIDSKAFYEPTLWWEDDIVEVPTAEMAFAPLAGLPALSSLMLSIPDLKWLPSAVVQLPSLRVLHLSVSAASLDVQPWDVLPPPPLAYSRWAAQLLLLSLEERWAVSHADSLALATSLTRLELGTADMCAEDEDMLPFFFGNLDDFPYDRSELLRFLQVLLWLPALQSLCYLEPREPTVLPSFLRECPECLQALEDLRAARPRFAEVLFDEARMLRAHA